MTRHPLVGYTPGDMLMLAIRAKKAAQPARTAGAAGIEGEPSAGSQGPATAPAREAEVDALVQDLLRDVVEPTRPAVYAVALSTAQAMRRSFEFQRALDSTPATRGGWCLMERLARLREAEDRAVQRGLLALDLLRQRQVEIRAELVGRRRREGARDRVH